MTKPSFLNCNRPLATVMVQAETPKRIIELIDCAYPAGADAFGMQFCKLKPEHRNEVTYKKLFAATHGLPVYVTNYRGHENAGKSDAVLCNELITLAKCGATLCDVMGDLFDPQPDEFTSNPDAVQRQTEVINAIHDAGGEVLMSSHTHAVTSAERVLEIALGQQERGADICKIVTKALTPENELEYMRLIPRLKKELKIPLLLLCGGDHHRLLRRVGGSLGNCMHLCVFAYDALATKAQPLLSDIKVIEKLLG